MVSTNPSSARALWFTGAGRVELRTEALPLVGGNDVVARALYSAVSHGTEGLLLKGDAPEQFDTSLGDTAKPVYPRRYGYAWVGEVISGALPRGTRIFALANHADTHVLQRDQVRVLPADLSPKCATLAASLETALNAVWDSELCFGEQVLVLGAGTVGLLLALVAQAAGARVTLVDVDASRCERARRCGVHQVLAGQPVGEFDVVFEVSGNPGVIDTAISHCGFEGRILVVSFYGTRRAPVALGERFHRLRQRLISSQVSTIPLRLRSHIDHARRFELVLDLLRTLSLAELVEHSTRFEDVPAAYAALVQAAVCQIVIDYQS